MRRYHQIVLAALLSVAATSAVAQERGGPGRGGPQGGFGGAMLLGQKSVQTDLKLSEEQVKQVEELNAKQREGFQGFRDLSREERAKRFTESREANQKALDEILSDEQRTRLEQITLQLSGGRALANPEIAEKLGLSDEQKKSVEEIQTASREEMRSIMEDAGGNRAEAFRKMREAGEATSTKLKGVLTEEQQAKWQTLTGPKFEGQLERPRGGERRRRSRQGADNRSAGTTTVLTADKSEEKAAERTVELKVDGVNVTSDGKADADKPKKKHAKKSRAKRGDHGKHRKHASEGKHHGKHAHHAKRSGESEGRSHGPRGMAHRGHRPPFHGVAFGRGEAHAAWRHHGQPHHGRHHHAHHRPGQSRPGQGRGPGGMDARQLAWHRVAMAMGAEHGRRSFSHEGHRRHGWQPPHHRGPGFANRSFGGRGCGDHGYRGHAFHGHAFHGHRPGGHRGPQHAWHRGPSRGEFAGHRGHGRRPPHGWGHPGLHGPGGPHFAAFGMHGGSRPHFAHFAGPSRHRSHEGFARSGDHGRGRHHAGPPHLHGMRHGEGGRMHMTSFKRGSKKPHGHAREAGDRGRGEHREKAGDRPDGKEHAKHRKGHGKPGGGKRERAERGAPKQEGEKAKQSPKEEVKSSEQD